MDDELTLPMPPSGAASLPHAHADAPEAPPIATEATFEAAAEATAEAAAEPAAEAAAETVPTAPELVPPPLTAEEIAAMAAAAPVPSAAEIAALAAAAEAAIPAAFPVPRHGDLGSDLVVDPPKRRRVRLSRFRVGLVRLAALAFGIALFVGGLAAGMSLYQRSLPVAPLVGDPSTGGVQTPAVVAELVDAMTTNNADSIRSVVNNDSYRLLAGELQTWQIQGVTSVKALATMVDGDRSATEIIISGKTSSGNPLIINLVVQVKAGQIVSFR